MSSPCLILFLNLYDLASGGLSISVVGWSVDFQFNRWRLFGKAVGGNHREKYNDLPLFVWFWRLQIADADGIVNCNSEGFFLDFFFFNGRTWRFFFFFCFFYIFFVLWCQDGVFPIGVLGKLEREEELVLALIVCGL